MKLYIHLSNNLQKPLLRTRLFAQPLFFTLDTRLYVASPVLTKQIYMTRGDCHIKDRVIKHGHSGDRQYDESLSQGPVENVNSVECRDRQHDEYSVFHTNIMENDIMSCTIDHFS